MSKLALHVRKRRRGSRLSPTSAESEAFLAVLADVLKRFRPDVVLTYGGRAATKGEASERRVTLPAMELEWRVAA